MDRRKDTPLGGGPGTADRNGSGRHRRGVRPRLRTGDGRRERERFLGAGHYERTPDRRGHANATLSKRVDTPAGTVTVQVPKTAGHDGEPCLTAIAGARATIGARRHAGGGRDVHQGVRRIGKRSGGSFSRRTDPRGRGRDARVRRRVPVILAGQPRRQAARRRTGGPGSDRPLGEIKYLILDARYEKMRHGGVRRENSPPDCFLILLTARCRRALGHRHRPGRAPPGSGRVGGPVGGRGSLAPSSGKRSPGSFSDPPQSSKASSPAACAGSTSSSPTTTAACAPPGAPSSAVPLGSAVVRRENGPLDRFLFLLTTWPGTPSITPPVPRLPSASGAS